MATTTERHIDNLRAMSSREQAADYVAAIKGAALADLAKTLHCNFGTVAQQRARIVQATVGARLDHAAIRNWRH